MNISLLSVNRINYHVNYCHRTIYSLYSNDLTIQVNFESFSKIQIFTNFMNIIMWHKIGHIYNPPVAEADFYFGGGGL